jgi:hypothetical protein
MTQDFLILYLLCPMFGWCNRLCSLWGPDAIRDRGWVREAEDKCREYHEHASIEGALAFFT